MGGEEVLVAAFSNTEGIVFSWLALYVVLPRFASAELNDFPFALLLFHFVGITLYNEKC